MMVNLFNPTEYVVSSHIRGVQITVPAKGTTSVTQKKAQAMLREFPQLTMTRKREHTEADYAALEKMRKDDLIKFTELIMRGSEVSAAEFADQQIAQREHNKNKVKEEIDGESEEVF